MRILNEEEARIHGYNLGFRELMHHALTFLSHDNDAKRYGKFLRDEPEHVDVVVPAKIRKSIRIGRVDYDPTNEHLDHADVIAGLEKAARLIEMTLQIAKTSTSTTENNHAPTPTDQ